MVNVDIKKQQSKINKKTFDFVNQMAPDLWSQAQVLKWLIYKNLPALIPTFKTHNIDGFLMLSLDTDILINDLKVTDVNTTDLLLSLISTELLPLSSSSYVQFNVSHNPLKKSLQRGPSSSALHFVWGEVCVIGSRVDFQDASLEWTSAIVGDTDPISSRAFICFLNSPADFDEWVPVSSPRLSLRDSKTKFSTDATEALVAALIPEEEISALKHSYNPFCFSGEKGGQNASDSKGVFAVQKAEESSDSASAETAKKTPEAEERWVSAYSEPEVLHEVSDASVFSFLAKCLVTRGEINAERANKELGLGRARARRCLEDFFHKFVNGEALVPPEVKENIAPSKKPKVETPNKRKRSRRTTAMLTEDWREGNRKGLWRCPKCDAVLTAQKRYTHPCFRDNLLTIEQYNQSLNANQYQSFAGFD